MYEATSFSILIVLTLQQKGHSVSKNPKSLVLGAAAAGRRQRGYLPWVALHGRHFGLNIAKLHMASTY